MSAIRYPSLFFRRLFLSMCLCMHGALYVVPNGI